MTLDVLRRTQDSRGQARKLLSIQCLRALAAIVVVIHHMRVFEPKYDPGAVLAPHVLEFGQAGVDLFFVISGFIMVTISVGRFGAPGAASRFLWQRFLRVYPIYWVYCLAVLAVFLVHPGWVNSEHGPPDLLRSFLLLPQRNLPLLLVAWTLVYEMFFYVVFAAMLRWVSRKLLPVALLVWAAVTVAGVIMLAPTPDEPVLGLVFSPLILEFIAGCLIAVSARVLGARTGLALVVGGVLWLAASTVGLDRAGAEFPSFGWQRLFLFGLPAACLVAGVIRVEAAGWRSSFPRPLVLVGDASYSLYLSHVLVIAVVGRLWGQFLAGPSALNHIIGLGCVFVAAIVGGLAGFRLIEAPMHAALRRKQTRRPATAAAFGRL
jgi:exopolysaccharide production protein ExoZ